MSRSRLVYSDGGARVEALVDFSREWNASVGITGALAFTELHFVQYIEGPQWAIDDMLLKLRADSRHTSINIIEQSIIPERRFDGWSLAYSGPDTFIDRELGPALASQACTAATANKLRSLLQAMVKHA